MTWLAPIEATISTFAVLHTPVTSAPNAVASCTANVPTSPAAPLASTRCPGWTCPLSRSACNAVTPATGTAAACSNVRPALEHRRVVADADALSQGPAALQATEHLIPGRGQTYSIRATGFACPGGRHGS